MFASGVQWEACHATELGARTQLCLLQQQEAISFPAVSEGAVQTIASSLVQSWEEIVLGSCPLSLQLQKGLGEMSCTDS